MSLPKTIPDTSSPVYVTVPPTDIHLVYGQQITFECLQQNWTICFATNSKWPQLSGKSSSNVGLPATAPSVDVDLAYNVVTVGPCSAISIGDTGATIHVRSTGLHKVQG